MTEQRLWKEKIWIIDTSSIFEVNRVNTLSLGEDDKKRIYGELEKLIAQGVLGFPKQVKAEASDQGYDDAPAKWTRRMHKAYLQADPGRSKFNPSYEYFTEVMSRAGNVVDTRKEDPEQEADPYILAVGLELRASGLDAIVISQETNRVSPRDGLPAGKISIKAAGELLGIPTVNLREFLEEQGWL